MVKAGVIVAAIICCILVVIGTILGVWGSGVACPDFGMDCAPSPGSPPATGTPSTGTPSTGTPSTGTPSRGASSAGTPSTGTSSSGTPLASLGSTPDSAATTENTGTPSTPPSSASTGQVNCIGYWDACSVTCGTGVQTYRITTPASGGGASCKDTDGTTVRAAGDTKPCSMPVCGVDCVGDWVKSTSTDADGWGPCSATCGAGTQTRTYRITTQQAGGGTSCPKANGATETRACPNLPACAQPVNCVGAWGEWSGCSAGCGGGTRTRTYYISTPAANGGTACPKTNGQTESEACNSTPCCDAATTGDWYDVGGVICTGSSSPDPYIYQSRAITFPINPVGSATATACGITTARTRNTAGPDPTGNKCPDRNPVGGTCTYGAYSGGCPVASTVQGTATACSQSGISGTYTYKLESGRCWRAPRSCTRTGGCTVGTYTAMDSLVTDWTCPANTSKGATPRNCVGNPNSITSLTCDSSAHFTPNIATNKCVAK
jgi:hypothetical protein